MKKTKTAKKSAPCQTADNRLIFLLGLILESCSVFGIYPGINCQDDISGKNIINDTDSYQIYGEISETFVTARNSKYFITTLNTSWETSFSKSKPTEYIDYLKENFPELEENIVNRINNPKECVLDSEKLDKSKYRIIKKCEIMEIFKNYDGWKRLRNIYPNSLGTLNVSDVLYSIDRSHAFVYAGNRIGNLGGSGQYFYLIKENGKWKILRKRLAWIS